MTDSRPPAPDNATECPLCGFDNRCAVAAIAPASVADSAADGEAAGCWCQAERIDEGLRSWLQDVGLGDRCLCRNCARGSVPSPCQQICQMDPRNETCLGCARTLDEIGQWAQLSAIERARVWLRIRPQGSPSSADG